MKEQTVRPRFATLQYDVLKELGISVAEYFYLDMMYYLSREGWCYKSLESVAGDMNITKNGVQKMRDRLIEKGLLNKDRKGRVRTSVMYNKVYLQDSVGYTKLQKGYTKSTSGGIQSITKNNIENNKEKKSDFSKAQNPNPTTDSQAHANARRASDLIRERFGGKLKLKPHA